MENKILELVILVIFAGLNFLILWFPFHREYISKTTSIDLSKKVLDKIKPSK